MRYTQNGIDDKVGSKRFGKINIKEKTNKKQQKINRQNKEYHFCQQEPNTEECLTLKILC